MPQWTEAAGLNDGPQSLWKDSDRFDASGVTAWNEAAHLSGGAESGFKPRLPLLSPDVVLSFADGISLPQTLKSGIGDGLHVDTAWSTEWNDAGLAYNAWLPPYVPPPPPEPPHPPLILNLRYVRVSGPLVLNLGYTRPAWDVSDRRYYAVLNTCSVVRLPDRTELPVTAVSAETDCDSWAWRSKLRSTAWCGPRCWMTRN